MAALICWASGLLEVVQNKDVPDEGGPITLRTGLAGKLLALRAKHGQHNPADGGWYIPGALDVPTEGRTDDDVQQDRLVLLTEFTKQLGRDWLRQKGRGHLLKEPQNAQSE